MKEFADNTLNVTPASNSEQQLVDARKLLEILFSEESRPTVRWLRDQQKTRRIPFIKIGRLVFFSPEQVRRSLGSQKKLTGF